MNIQDFNKRLRYSLHSNSGLSERQEYLGISKLSDCPRKTVREFLQGIHPTNDLHRYAYRAYAVGRCVRDLFNHSLLIREPMFDKEERTITVRHPAWGGLYLQGKIDARLRDVNGILEIKVVDSKKLTAIRRRKKALPAHFRQVQAYMHFGGWKEAVISYWDPTTFQHYNVFVTYSPSVGNQLELRALALMNYISTKNLPVCECGRCSDVEKEVRHEAIK